MCQVVPTSCTPTVAMRKPCRSGKAAQIKLALFQNYRHSQEAVFIFYFIFWRKTPVTLSALNMNDCSSFFLKIRGIKTIDNFHGSKQIGLAIGCKVLLEPFTKDFQLSLVRSLFRNSQLCAIYNILTGISGREARW